jgi:hypothetical protein
MLFHKILADDYWKSARKLKMRQLTETLGRWGTKWKTFLGQSGAKMHMI